MPDAIITTILSIAGVLLSGTIGHVLGQRAERQKQSLIIRAEMLQPIDEWLKGAEKIVGIFSDTLPLVCKWYVLRRSHLQEKVVRSWG